MKKQFYQIFTFLLLISQSANAQWTLDESFVPQLVPDQENIDSGIHGVAVDPGGKVWIQTFFHLDSVLTTRTSEWLSTNALYIFEPDGTPAEFSPLKIIFYPNSNFLPDTLGRRWSSENNAYESSFGRGLTTDPDGNIIISTSRKVIKVNYETGFGISRVHQPIENSAALTEASTDASGNIYVASVLPGNPIVLFDPYLNEQGNLINSTEGFSRDFEVSVDGNTIFWAGYTNRALYRYTRPNEFSPFEQVPDTILKGFSTESMTIHPVTGHLWVSSGSTSDPPNQWEGKETNWTVQTWYAFDINDDLIHDPSPVDSITWITDNSGYLDGRPRAIDFSPDGNTVYLGNFFETLPAIQKFDLTGLISAEVTFSVDIGPFQKYGEFDPDTDLLSVIGNFNDWDPLQNPLELDQDSIYNTTIPFIDFSIEDTIFYQFVLNKSDGSFLTETLDSTNVRSIVLNDLGPDSDGNGLREKNPETPFFNNFSFEDVTTKVIAAPDEFIISSNFPDTLSVLTNDFLFGQNVTVSLALVDEIGNESIVQDTLIVFNPTPGSTKKYRTDYFLISQLGDTVGASFMDVTIINDGPVVLNPDTLKIPSGISLIIEPLKNDIVISSEAPLEIFDVTNGEFGTADVSLSKTKIIYSPISGYIGEDRLIYSVQTMDGSVFEQFIYLDIIVPTDSNSAPVILLPVEITTLEDSKLIFGLHKVISDDRDNISDLSVFTHPTLNLLTSIDTETGLVSISSPEDWWGQETLILTVTDVDGLSRTDSSRITVTPVNDFPTSAFSILGESNTLSFVDNSNDNKDFGDGGIVKWDWNFGDGSTSTEQSPEHTFIEIGNYDVTLTVTDNGGLTSTESKSVFISAIVSGETESTMPTNYALSQNYPNPFNPTTTIRYALPVATEVRVTIYNSLGQLVQELFEGKKNAGFHNITLNATNLSSGVYIYRIEAGDFIETKKMILVK